MAALYGDHAVALSSSSLSSTTPRPLRRVVTAEEFLSLRWRGTAGSLFFPFPFRRNCRSRASASWISGVGRKFSVAFAMARGGGSTPSGSFPVSDALFSAWLRERHPLTGTLFSLKPQLFSIQRASPSLHRHTHFSLLFRDLNPFASLRMTPARRALPGLHPSRALRSCVFSGSSHFAVYPPSVSERTVCREPGLMRVGDS